MGAMDVPVDKPSAELASGWDDGVYKSVDPTEIATMALAEAPFLQAYAGSHPRAAQLSAREPSR